MEEINSKNVAKAIGPYSHAVKHDNMLFTSGQLPLNVEGEVVSDDVKEQADQVLKNVESILKEVGMDFNNVLKATIYIKDMNDFQTINEVYETYVSGKLPARSCVEVSRLPKDVKVEIDVIASI